MSVLWTTAGSKLYIGGIIADKNADFTEGDFSGQSWTEIGGTTNLGSAGDTAELVSSKQIAVGRVKKAKGTFNAGAMEVVCDHDPNDPGQAALYAAAKTRDNYAFKLVFNDAPTGGTPSVRYFIGLVMSAPETYEEADSVMKLSTSVEINSNLVKINATLDGSAPVVTEFPAITGTAKVGETLTVSAGAWDGSPAPSLSYQWFVGGESIPAATGTTYQPVVGDVGEIITVMVTATNFHGHAVAIAAPTTEVAEAD